MRDQDNPMPPSGQAEITHQAPAPGAGRQWIVELIREQYDKAPDHYRAGDYWEDGAEAIAEAIFAQLPLLAAEREAELPYKGAGLDGY